LTTYFKNRKTEDEENIERERKLGHLLEVELLKAQNITNKRDVENNNLQIQRT
jgi:hypothetical protein